MVPGHGDQNSGWIIALFILELELLVCKQGKHLHIAAK